MGQGEAEFTDVSCTLDARAKEGPRRNQLSTAVYTVTGHGQYAEGAGTLRAAGGDCGEGSEMLVAGTLAASGAGSERPAGNCNETDMIVLSEPNAYGLSMASDVIVADDIAQPITSRNGDPGVVAIRNGGRDADERPGRSAVTTQDDVMFALQAEQQHAIAFQSRHFTRDNKTGGAPAEVTPTLGADPKQGDSETLVAFSCKDDGRDATDDLSPTLRAIEHDQGNANGVSTIAISQMSAVRRLTPRECERLQGFPDDYTMVPTFRKRVSEKSAKFIKTAMQNGLTADQMHAILAAYHGITRDELRGVGVTPDGPRYRALGNSMAVPVMRWIGERIQEVENMKEQI